MIFLPGYEPIAPSTWAYVSSLLMLALFFKFNRFWSFRNIDLILIILLAPGLLMVYNGEKEHRDELDKQADPLLTVAPDNVFGSQSPDTEQSDEEPLSSDLAPEAENGAPAALTSGQYLQRSGYVWLFGIGLILLFRLLYDPLIKRKPMLEPNLSKGGLIFLACSLMIFLFANVMRSSPDLAGPRGAVQIAQRVSNEDGSEHLKEHGPGFPLIFLLPSIPTFVDNQGIVEDSPSEVQYADVARFMAIISQIGIIGGLVYIGHRHFGNFSMGVGMATIFLMLPYTAQYSGETMHLLPGALLVLAIAAYRRPLFSGLIVGLAAGVFYYPLFLLPLWISFYWERGRARFAMGAVTSIAMVVTSLAFTSDSLGGFFQQLQSIFGAWSPVFDGLEGVWSLNWNAWYRLPLLVGYIVLCFSYVFWPVSKNLATLISCQAAAMVAVQFWHGFGGGLLMAWYLPLFLLIVFRPNLDGQVAAAVVSTRRRRTDATDTPAVAGA